jgi:hypothetical protein
MATQSYDPERLIPAAGAPARPFAPRAALLSAMAVRNIGPLSATAAVLWAPPWHATSSSGAIPVMFFALATVIRAGVRPYRRHIRAPRGSWRRRMGIW